MSRQVTMPPSPPKPKVFRLPPSASSSPVKALPAARARKKWPWGILLLAVGLIGSIAQQYTSAYLTRNTSGDSLRQTEPDGLAGIIQPPVSDAQAASSERPPTILLRGQSEAIIGQMAKISAENEPIIETKALSEVDNNAARELLSIISKY